ncbi:MAG: 50S ribosomal protein L5 [Planctomycetota bacterium]
MAEKKKKKGAESSAEAQAALEPNTPRLKQRYDDEIRAKVAEKFGVSNRMAQPELEKIVINVNMGRHLEGTKVPANIKGSVLDTLTKISGQKPVLVAAKKSVSNFKVREGYETAAKVTIRRDRMWHFLDRMINLTAPRIKDFRGLPPKAFDRQGSYSFGLTEQGVFPEIDMTAAPFQHGMNINLTFSNSTPQMSRFVLEELGFPFRKPEKSRKAG